MVTQCLNRDWKFILNPPRRPDGEWEARTAIAVDLPHDFSICQTRTPEARGGNAVGYFPGGIGQYVKMLDVPASWRGKTVLLEFDGVYMNAEVWVNGHLVAKHPYGYTAFHADLTPYLTYGQPNRIQVLVRNDAQPNSRWYSGSGIYRDVRLLVAEPVHIAPWGVFVTTPVVDAEASTVQVATRLENRTAAWQKAVLTTTLYAPCGREVGRCETPATLHAGGGLQVRQQMVVAPAQLWDLEHPERYTAKSELYVDGQLMDTAETRFGIRSVTVDAVHGFRLNGVSMKLKGGCIHHDNGVLGACAFPRAEERRVALMKAAGFNALRSAHNPPSTALLEACDRLGMLVMDETFDSWRMGKNPFDYNLYFEDWWQRDIESMVLRDRNHPCVIAYSIGNEINERGDDSDGANWAWKQAELVRSLDATRPVTSALNPVRDPEDTSWRIEADPRAEELRHPSFPDTPALSSSAAFGELTAPYAAALDFMGYNYLDRFYEAHAQAYPNRVMCGTETFPMMIAPLWKQVMAIPALIGDFVWTSWDYLGESGIGQIQHGEGADPMVMGGYPWHIGYCADFDLCGYRRPQSYYRELVWGGRTAPYIAVEKPQFYGQPYACSMWGWADVVESWNWPGYEGKPVCVDVYCAQEEVELFLNGQSLGRQPAGPNHRYAARFTTAYAPGELTAVGYEDGVETARWTLATSGAAVALRMEVDRADLAADGQDLAYITLSWVDEAGRRVFDETAPMSVTVEGAGSLAGLGSGDPVSQEGYAGPSRAAFEGRLLAVVRAASVPGAIRVVARGEKGSAEAELHCQ